MKCGCKPHACACRSERPQTTLEPHDFLREFFITPEHEDYLPPSYTSVIQDQPEAPAIFRPVPTPQFSSCMYNNLTTETNYPALTLAQTTAHPSDFMGDSLEVQQNLTEFPLENVAAELAEHIIDKDKHQVELTSQMNTIVQDSNLNLNLPSINSFLTDDQSPDANSLAPTLSCSPSSQLASTSDRPPLSNISPTKCVTSYGKVEVAVSNIKIESDINRSPIRGASPPKFAELRPRDNSAQEVAYTQLASQQQSLPNGDMQLIRNQLASTEAFNTTFSAACNEVARQNFSYSSQPTSYYTDITRPLSF